MTGRPDAFMPLFVGDYLRDTLALTRDQHGAYLLLLMAYWGAGAALPDDDHRLAGIAKATRREWRTLRPALAPFFDVRDGAWHHKRVDEELKKAGEKYAARREASLRANAKRWGAKPRGAGAAIRDGSQPHSHPHPQDLSPSGSSRSGSRARGDGEAAPPAPPADWSAAHEAWRAAKASIGERDWQLWFADCRLAADGALVAPTRFSAEMIAEKFGTALARRFGAAVRIVVKPKEQAAQEEDA